MIIFFLLCYFEKDQVDLMARTVSNYPPNIFDQFHKPSVNVFDMFCGPDKQ